jgi:hypothetical protein
VNVISEPWLSYSLLNARLGSKGIQMLYYRNIGGRGRGGRGGTRWG